MPLADLEHAFITNLLQPQINETDFLAEWQSTDSLSVDKQLAIYRSNISGAYQKVLGQIYPACLNILGEEYFNQLCRIYRFEYPSRQADLNHYGEYFPAFLQTQLSNHDELDGFDYLSDLALLEWHWHACYFAKNDELFDFEKLALVEDKNQNFLVFSLSDSFTLQATIFPLLEIWQANRNLPDEHQEFLMPEAEKYFCIVRHEYEPLLEYLTTHQYKLLKAITDGLSLTQLAELAKLYDENLQNQLLMFIQKGWVTGFSIQDNSGIVPGMSRAEPELIKDR